MRTAESEQKNHAKTEVSPAEGFNRQKLQVFAGSATDGFVVAVLYGTRDLIGCLGCASHKGGRSNFGKERTEHMKR